MDYAWDDLKTFLACHRTGSLARAGRALRVDQTTAGRRLAALESALGARLFDRVTRKMTLTAAGASLLELAEQVEQSAIDLGRRAEGADARVEGVVRLATSETLATTFVARQLGPLHAAHPRLELELVTGQTSLNLLRREADLALRAGPRPTQQSLILRRLGRHGFGLFASRAVSRRKQRRFIGYCDDLAAIPPVRWLEEHRGGEPYSLRANSLITAAQAALGGLGVCAIPIFLGLRTPGLVRVSAEEVGSSEFWIVVHPDLQHTARVRVVIDHLAAVMRAEEVVE